MFLFELVDDILSLFTFPTASCLHCGMALQRNAVVKLKARVS